MSGRTACARTNRIPTTEKIAFGEMDKEGRRLADSVFKRDDVLPKFDHTPAIVTTGSRIAGKVPAQGADKTVGDVYVQDPS